jgi:predicted site-specific integrase-resolvase
MIKLSKFAKDLGVTKMTLWNWKSAGKLKFHKIGGMNFVDTETYNKFIGVKEKSEEKIVIYCRVSSTVNKTNLESQKDRMISYCTARGYKIHDVITEFGSGLNDSRPKLQKLLSEQDFTKIVVEHKDRLTRFGFNYIETMLRANKKEIEVVNQVSVGNEDIVQDFVSEITSFCARIYGKRRSKRKTIELIETLKVDKQ